MLICCVYVRVIDVLDKLRLSHYFVISYFTHCNGDITCVSVWLCLCVFSIFILCKRRDNAKDRTSRSWLVWGDFHLRIILFIIFSPRLFNRFKVLQFHLRWREKESRVRINAKDDNILWQAKRQLQMKKQKRIFNDFFSRKKQSETKLESKMNGSKTNQSEMRTANMMNSQWICISNGKMKTS